MKHSYIVAMAAIVGLASSAMGQWWWPPQGQPDLVGPCESVPTARLTLTGEWHDTCRPTGMSRHFDGTTIRVEVMHDYPPMQVCGDGITPWGDREIIEGLPAGSFEIIATLTDHGRVVMGPTSLGVVTSQCVCLTDVDDGSFTGMQDGGVTIDDLVFCLAGFEAGC